MNVFDPILLQAALDPMRPAIAYPGGLSSYGMLARSAAVVAGNLRDLGVTAGDICAIRVPDPLLHLLLILGLGRIGAASLSLPDLQALDAMGVAVRPFLVAGALPDDRAGPAMTIDDSFYTKGAAQQMAVIRGHQSGPLDLASVSLSSGSTGRPKAIGLDQTVLEHRMTLPVGGSGDRHRTLSMLGFDTFGGLLNTIHALRRGGLVCFAPDGPLVLEMAGFFAINELVAAPAQIASLVRQQRQRPRSLPALHTVFATGAAMPVDLLVETERLLGGTLMICYASTEAGVISFAPSSLMGPDGKTCGYPMPWLDVAITDEQGAALPLNAEGMIRLRGRGVIESYLNPAPEDVEIFREGWFASGDLGRIGENGLLHVTGRIGTRINRGGTKILPESIETALEACPGLREVGVAALTTADGNIRVLAALVPDGEAPALVEVQRFCAARMPDRIPDDFFFVEALPRTSMGKIAREALRLMLQDRYVKS